ncbi:DNA-binding transcriptional MocR family regulator [Pseudomonas helmanticensis]|uniref:DNA-binding transcriptional MocR family regulator n=1 Tax=Pseudomonas helmanticensis TaxID=1471381 RepID=A0A4V6Q6J8_9PSED|nr:PLP-dependent aminotransferase family protein [Pseudomonas helmanticensis]TDV41641.1 DNA-binding transcriptional MocR family regulator [Pseudomonas helmanticensis]
MKASRENDFVYQAVYRYLTLLIDEAGSSAAVRLPSLRQLADRLNVSISTVQYAYSLLEKEGRVYSIAKSGYYAQALHVMDAPESGSDLLETVYVNARRPGMCVLSADDPASLQPLDSPLLMLERELLRQYPRQPQALVQPCGELELRTVLAARYTSSTANYWRADDVYIGADLRGVLEILISVLELRRATVIVESPCDWVILRLLAAAEVRVIELPLLAGGVIDPQRLESLLKSEAVRLILLSSALSMPRGSLIPLSNQQAIAHLLGLHGTWVLENDCYSELHEGGAPQRLRDWLDPDRLLVFSTFEKFIGAEAPFGFLLSRHWRNELQRHFLLRAFRLSPIRQKAIARLLGGGRLDQHLLVLRRMLKERRTQLIELLRERLGDALQIVEPKGGATVWVRSLRPVNMGHVFQHLLRQQIIVAPGELFSLQGLHAQHVRLSPLSHGEHDLASVVGLFGDALRLAPGD